MPDGNYDHVPLLEKLGVKEGCRLLTLGFDDLTFLQGRSCAQSYGEGDVFDLIILRSETMQGLDVIETLIPHLVAGGAIWTVTPKGVKDFSGTDVILRGRAAGLNDTKVCSFSETHTGRRFMRRKT